MYVVQTTGYGPCGKSKRWEALMLSGRSRRSSRCSSSCRSPTRRRTTVTCATTRERTWASFVAMTDAQLRACRPTSSTPTARPACRRRRPTSAPTCGAPSRPQRLGHHPRAASSSPRLSQTLTTLEHMERYGTPASTTTGTTTARARSSPTGRRARPELPPDPLLGRQRLARRRPEDRREQRPAAAHARAARSTTRWTSASTTGPTSTACCSTTGPTTRPRRPAATTPSSARAASSTTSASPAASCRRRSTTAAGARSRTPATTRSRRPSRSATCAALLRRRRLRGRLPVRRHAARAVAGAAACSRR